MRLGTKGGWGSYPIRAGYFEQLDRMAEAAAELVDVIARLVEDGADEAWAIREAELLIAGEDARREASRALTGGSAVAFAGRLFELAQAQAHVLRSLGKVGLRLSCCVDVPSTRDAWGVADNILALAAVANELRAAVRCLGSPGHRPEALAHCEEVRRMSGVVDELRRLPISEAETSTWPARALAWESAFAAIAEASRACVEAAALIGITAVEA